MSVPLPPVVTTLEVPVPDDDSTVEVTVSVRRSAIPTLTSGGGLLSPGLTLHDSGAGPEYLDRQAPD